VEPSEPSYAVGLVTFVLFRSFFFSEGDAIGAFTNEKIRSF